ncbi:MAG: HIT domain-containing protein [Candidatus Brocadiae bacterium]|nr:HIT domain-containing protein [Candidatus Brocadiia bacterium]
MDRIWAPWRMELIRQAAPQGCFFCEYAKENNADADEKNLVLERGEHCFVVMNRYPYSNGHLMVSPYKHTGDLSALDIPTRSDLMEYTTRWQKILSQAVKAQGFNIGMNIGKVAGAGVDDHIHIHIVPRWLGDTNFMTSLSDTKVINQSLIELYRILKNTMG